MKGSLGPRIQELERFLAMRGSAERLCRAYALLCRNFKQELEELVGEDTRPAPAAVTTAQVTDNINRGTHLLGLLNNRMISASQEGLYESGGQQDLPKGTSRTCCTLPILRAKQQQSISCIRSIYLASRLVLSIHLSFLEHVHTSEWRLKQQAESCCWCCCCKGQMNNQTMISLRSAIQLSWYLVRALDLGMQQWCLLAKLVSRISRGFSPHPKPLAKLKHMLLYRTRDLPRFRKVSQSRESGNAIEKGKRSISFRLRFRSAVHHG